MLINKLEWIVPPISMSDVADVNLYTANRIKWILRTLIMNDKLISRRVRQDDKTKLEISLSRHCGERNIFNSNSKWTNFGVLQKRECYSFFNGGIIVNLWKENYGQGKN